MTTKKKYDLEYDLNKIKERLEGELSGKIKKIGVTRSAAMLDLHESDVSSWMNKQRNYSIWKLDRLNKKLNEKILKENKE